MKVRYYLETIDSFLKKSGRTWFDINWASLYFSNGRTVSASNRETNPIICNLRKKGYLDERKLCTGHVQYALTKYSKNILSEKSKNEI